MGKAGFKAKSADYGRFCGFWVVGYPQPVSFWILSKKTTPR
jgi:hypothetical protein